MRYADASESHFVEVAVIGLGLGLGLGGQSGRPAKAVARDTISQAIKDRVHVVATIDGGKVLLAPYALLDIPGDGLVVDAVIVLGADAGWPIERLPVAKLTAVKLHHIEFVPNGAFDPAGYCDAISIVDPVKDIDDTLEAKTG